MERLLGCCCPIDSNTHDTYHYPNSKDAFIRNLHPYRLAPSFMLQGGRHLHDQLRAKYGVNYTPTWRDHLKSILVFMFCDELITITLFITLIVLALHVWIPNIQQQAYTAGFNQLQSYNIPECYDSANYQVCYFCDQSILMEFINNSAQYSIYYNGNASIPHYGHCPQVAITGIAAIQAAVAADSAYWIDNASRVNDTYVSYLFYGSFESGGNWFAAQYNQTEQALYAQHNAGILCYFALSLILFTWAALIFAINTIGEYSCRLYCVI